MKIRILLSLFLVFGVAWADTSDEQDEHSTEKVIERSQDSANMLDQIMSTPDAAVPRSLLLKARCLALIPGVKKAGFVFAGKFGKGFLVCRGTEPEAWHGPSALRLEGGSFGFQVGGSSTDVVLLVMNDEGVDKLLSSKFTLGADAAVAAGPVGRNAQVQTDAQMHAKMLAYSRSRGLFAGLSIEGATLRPDSDANRAIYGEDIPAKQIVAGEGRPPKEMRGLLETIAKYATPKEGEVVEEPPMPVEVTQTKPTLLTITSDPDYAEVELNRNFNGLTPRTKQVEPGEYQIKVSKRGFQPWTKTISVPRGETVTVHASLGTVEADTPKGDEPTTLTPGDTGIRISGWRPED